MSVMSAESVSELPEIRMPTEKEIHEMLIRIHGREKGYEHDLMFFKQFLDTPMKKQLRGHLQMRMVVILAIHEQRFNDVYYYMQQPYFFPVDDNTDFFEVLNQWFLKVKEVKDKDYLYEENQFEPGRGFSFLDFLLLMVEFRKNPNMNRSEIHRIASMLSQPFKHVHKWIRKRREQEQINAENAGYKNWLS